MSEEVKKSAEEEHYPKVVVVVPPPKYSNPTPRPRIEISTKPFLNNKTDRMVRPRILLYADSIDEVIHLLQEMKTDLKEKDEDWSILKRSRSVKARLYGDTQAPPNRPFKQAFEKLEETSPSLKDLVRIEVSE
tara:strand:+ start:2766 stop:3164 length:399 start_codon:yes stop_codon:yes gene_type:complete